MAKVNFEVNMRAGADVNEEKKEEDNVITVDSNTVVTKTVEEYIEQIEKKK